MLGKEAAAQWQWVEPGPKLFGFGPREGSYEKERMHSGGIDYSVVYHIIDMEKSRTT